MESTSEPMKIQISDATKRLLDDKGEQRRRRSSTYCHHTKFSDGPKFVTKLREEVFYRLKISLVQHKIESQTYVIYHFKQILSVSQAITVPQFGPIVTHWLLGQKKETVSFDREESNVGTIPALSECDLPISMQNLHLDKNNEQI